MLENVDNIISQDPGAKFRLILDNLNTHASASIVRYIAHAIGDNQDPGEEGRPRHSKIDRYSTKFLTDRSHRIQILFTQRHCSWLNQIEMWFGTLRRKVTKLQIELVVGLSQQQYTRVGGGSLIGELDLTAAVEIRLETATVSFTHRVASVCAFGVEYQLNAGSDAWVLFFTQLSRE